MRPYTALVSGVLFPLQERLKGHHAAAARRWLEETQWLPADELAALQAERLQRLVQRAEARVPFYQARFAEAGVSAADLREPKDLRKLPLLDKGAIRAAGDDLRARDAGPLTHSNTGGSSGEPLIFQLGRERVTHDVAAKWRATRWWGVDFGDPEVVLWGSPIELSAQDRLRGLRDRLQRTQLLPAFAMGEAQLDAFVAAIRRRRPRMLFGYPSALARVARHARARGTRLDDRGTEVAFVTAERLYPEQKQIIESVFGCRVANGYGGRDAGFLAHQCPHGGLHVTAEDVVLEVVDPQGRSLPPGQAGQVVITHLASGDYPFIRYATGDVATLAQDPCPCGRGLPLVEEVHGRSTDFLVARDGTVMHGLALIYVIRDIPEIRSFRIVQEDLEHTRVQVVPRGELSRETRHRIQSGFRERLGSEVTVKVEPVAAIPPEASGKYRYVQSKVAIEDV
ncbi:MAG TPA: AMP-binding protein [Gammaproteobacteria bacterium]|nr:AMP-binding protein [Gammaproteobacteria bacterium]